MVSQHNVTPHWHLSYHFSGHAAFQCACGRQHLHAAEGACGINAKAQPSAALLGFGSSFSAVCTCIDCLCVDSQPLCTTLQVVLLYLHLLSAGEESMAMFASS